MKELFVKFGKAVVLGVATILIAAILAILLSPILLAAGILIVPFGIVALGTLLLFLVLVAILYPLAWIGTAVYYARKPMEVSKEGKKYSIGKTKEAGRHQKK